MRISTTRTEERLAESESGRLKMPKVEAKGVESTMFRPYEKRLSLKT